MEDNAVILGDSERPHPNGMEAKVIFVIVGYASL